MREHLYRGKRKRDGVWIYGFYYTTEGKHFILGNENPDSDIQLAYEVNPETVGQYTGFKDKNGVKIFEGDIVRTNGVDGELLWKIEWGFFDYSPCFIPIGINHEWSSVHNKVWEEGEVIGNIHDNPDLLEENK